jgi:hypothetical protein
MEICTRDETRERMAARTVFLLCVLLWNSCKTHANMTTETGGIPLLDIVVSIYKYRYIVIVLDSGSSSRSSSSSSSSSRSRSSSRSNSINRTILILQYSLHGCTAASTLLNTTFRGLAPSPSSGKTDLYLQFHCQVVNRIFMLSFKKWIGYSCLVLTSELDFQIRSWTGSSCLVLTGELDLQVRY